MGNVLLVVVLAVVGLMVGLQVLVRSRADPTQRSISSTWPRTWASPGASR